MKDSRITKKLQPPRPRPTPPPLTGGRDPSDPLDPARFRGDALAGIAVGLMFAAVAGLARSAGWDWLSLPCFVAAGAAFYLVGFRRAR